MFSMANVIKTSGVCLGTGPKLLQRDCSNYLIHYCEPARPLNVFYNAVFG